METALICLVLHKAQSARNAFIISESDRRDSGAAVRGFDEK